MIKKIRERFWYTTAFFKKYLLHIGLGLFLSLFLALGYSFFDRYLPKSKPQYRIGLVGQYTASQLPNLLTSYLNAGLTSINANMEAVPNLAESWSVENNGNTYTFKIRSGLKWSNGDEVKVEDIKIAIPGLTTEVQTPNILKFNLPTKFSPFPSLLTFPLANSQGKIAGEYEIKIKQKTSGVITQITLESAKRKIIFTLYPNVSQALTAYKLGQIDMLPNLPANIDTESLKQYGQLQKSVNYNQEVMLIFNQVDQNLKDKSIRQAIAYGIKDKSFGEVAAKSTLNPNSWAFNSLTKDYPFNPARTQELIKTPLDLELSTLPELLPIAEKLKSQLDNDKLKLNIKVVTSTPEQFQLFLNIYNIPTDPDQYRDWHSTQSTNIGKNNDEKIDKYLEDGRTTIDQKERKKIYLEFQKVFSEELPALPLYYPSYYDLSRNNRQLIDLRK